MSDKNIRKSFIILALIGLSAGFCIAQEQPEFDNHEMIEPPEQQEGLDIEEMNRPPEFDGNASGTRRMRRPPRRRGDLASGTMDMFPPEFDENASGTRHMRRPPRRGHRPMEFNSQED